MLLLFQLLFSFFSAYAVLGVVMRKKDRLLGPKGMLFWVVFWLGALIFVWWPESSSSLATLFGIGRGTDFVLYISIAILFFLLFRLHIKIESVGRELTTLTRHMALKNPDDSSSR